MKKTILLLSLLFAALQFVIAQTPTLGTYPATAIATAGGNATVMPSATPANATAISAYTTSKFKGILQVNPSTGLLTITNAQPAGTYLITVKAFNGLQVPAITSFTLTVNNASCSQGLFTGTAYLPSNGANVRGVAIGDFNNDGKQDFAVANAGSNRVAVRLGDGTGAFTAAPNITTGEFPQAIAISDFNGDGNQDMAITNYLAATVSISLGNGTGSFTITINTNVSGNPVSIAVNDFNGDGKPDIATASNTNNVVSIRLGDGLGGFSGTTEVPVGSTPYSVVSGDFNNDGKPDLATANSNSSNVSIRLGNGAGGFTGTTTIPIGPNAQSIALGDFNNDGTPDFATANLSANNISVRMGDGNGNFSGTITLATGSGSYSVVIGDYNGDGKPDIAGMNSAGNITIWLGNGMGAFTAAPNVSVDFGALSGAIGDFNNDGRADFVVSANSGVSIAIRLGGVNEMDVQGNNTSIADGDTTAALADYTDFGPVSNNLVRTYTIRNTGNVNLTVTNIRFSGADTSLFKRSGIAVPAVIAAGGSTTFKVAFTPTSTGQKSAMVNIISDDCDEALYNFAIQATGIIVVPVLSTYTDTTIATGGNITLTPSASPTNPISIYADASPGFKGLLHVDTTTGKVFVTNAHPAGNYLITVKATHGISSATTSFTLTVNSPACSQGLFSGTGTITGSAGSRSVVVCDVNNDAKQDFIIANPTSGSIVTFAGNGLGGFTLASSVNVSTGSFPASLSIADFNGDGRQDMAIANTNINTVSIRLGNGTGAFNGVTDMPDIAVGNGPAWVVTSDFNKDGKPDFAAANSNGSTVSIRLGDGTGFFPQSTEVTVGANPFAIAIGDFNNDSIPDLATVNNIGNTVSISLGNGTGNFTTIANLPVGNSPVSVVVGDFNGDNKQDIAVSNQSGNSVSVLLGNGTGGFSSAANLVTASIPLALAVGDFNGDTKQDLAVTINGNNIVEIRLGNGNGGFGPAKNITVGTNPRSIAICDFNGDGRQDMVTANAALASSTGSIRFGNVNDILVKGNNTNISLGDVTPAEADFTDFGVTIAGVTSQRPFVIKNTGAVNLVINNIVLSGADASRFIVGGISLPAIIAAGDSATFTLSFTAAADGIKTATVTIVNDDCDEANYDFAVKAGATAGVALDFDGINDYISVNDTIGNTGTSGTTYSAWIKTSSTSTQTIMSKGNNCVATSFVYVGITATGRLIANFSDGINLQTLAGSATVNDGTWHQVTTVRNGNTLSLYVDGQLDVATISTATANISNTAPFLIGAIVCNSSSENYFSGQMDELRIYNTALTICQIQDNLKCELNGLPSGLLAYYKFNQGRAQESNTSTTTLVDESSNGNSGTLNNFSLADSISNWIKSGGVVAGQTCSSFNVWLGNSNNWDAANNWSKGFVPGECTKVMVSSGVPFMPQITNPQSSCFSLLLTGGAAITVKSAGHLTITGK